MVGFLGVTMAFSFGIIIGLIAGEMTAGIVVALVSAIYYWVTGVTPVYYKVFLG